MQNGPYHIGPTSPYRTPQKVPCAYWQNQSEWLSVRQTFSQPWPPYFLRYRQKQENLAPRFQQALVCKF